jgi:multiple sugar transport system permease protein
MNGTPQLIAIGRPLPVDRPWRKMWPQGWLPAPRIAEISWVIAFLIPYAAVFFGFVAWPVASGLWMGRDPELYAELAADPLYRRTLVNTLLFVGVGVNLKMFLALLLSGFFASRSRWIKALLVLYVLPWALPAIPAFLAIHWMLIGQWGFLNSLLAALFGVDGPIWFNSYWLALGANILADIWKWMPFWTLIFMAGRMAIPPEILEAADVDGATGVRRFAYVTFPLLASLYMICTLLSTLWMAGDFTTVYFVSGGAPALSTEVLATLGIHQAFDTANPPLGVATALSAMPLLIPLTIFLMRKVHVAGVQL